MRSIGAALLVMLAALPFGLALEPPARCGDTTPRVIDAFVTVMEVHENATLRLPRKRTTIFDVTTRITVKNTSEKTLHAPFTSIVNVNGAGCGDKKWTQSSPTVVSVDLTGDTGLEALPPGESATFSIHMEKRPNTQLTYEIVMYGVVEEANEGA